MQHSHWPSQVGGDGSQLSACETSPELDMAYTDNTLSPEGGTFLSASLSRYMAAAVLSLAHAASVVAVSISRGNGRAG